MVEILLQVLIVCGVNGRRYAVVAKIGVGRRSGFDNCPKKFRKHEFIKKKEEFRKLANRLIHEA